MLRLDWQPHQYAFPKLCACCCNCDRAVSSCRFQLAALPVCAECTTTYESVSPELSGDKHTTKRCLQQCVQWFILLTHTNANPHNTKWSAVTIPKSTLQRPKGIPRRQAGAMMPTSQCRRSNADVAVLSQDRPTFSTSRPQTPTTVTRASTSSCSSVNAVASTPNAMTFRASPLHPDDVTLATLLDCKRHRQFLRAHRDASTCSHTCNRSTAAWQHGSMAAVFSCSSAGQDQHPLPSPGAPPM